MLISIWVNKGKLCISRRIEVFNIRLLNMANTCIRAKLKMIMYIMVLYIKSLTNSPCS